MRHSAWQRVAIGPAMGLRSARLARGGARPKACCSADANDAACAFSCSYADDAITGVLYGVGDGGASAIALPVDTSERADI